MNKQPRYVLAHPLECFKKLPTEILFEYILAKISKSCLFVCKEWYQNLRDYLPYDSCVRAYNAFNYGITKLNVTLCLRSLPYLDWFEWDDLYNKYVMKTETPPEIVYGLAVHKFAMGSYNDINPTYSAEVCIMHN
jgi:hypothetical protein